MTEIKKLTGINTDELYAAMNKAFEGYTRSWTKEEFHKLLHRRGYTAELSYGAFNNENLVSFTFNGKGYFNGLKTIYDTGTGTIETHRGKGLSKMIFDTSLPALKECGARQYLLEVLQNNTGAVNIYTSVGFQIARELNYFVKEMKDLQLADKKTPEHVTLRETILPEESEAKTMWDFQPSWQNRHEALLKDVSNFRVVGAYCDNELAGYGLIEPASGDIPQLAVRSGQRRKGIATTILKKLLEYNRHNSMKVINTETSCEHMTLFLEHNGIMLSGRQYEMVLAL